LSVPAVAEEAGFSVPTVYRHFPSKKALVDAVYDRYSGEIGVQWDGDPPKTIDDLLARVPEVFARHEKVPSDLRSVMSGPTGRKARLANMPGRLAGVDQLLANVDLTDEDRERLREVLVVLTSSVVQQAFRDYFDASADVAADRVAWAIRRLVSPKRSRAKSKGGRR